MIAKWGYNYDKIFQSAFNIQTDKIFSFNSIKKRSTAIITKPDNSVMLYCKGEQNKWSYCTKDILLIKIYYISLRCF